MREIARRAAVPERYAGEPLAAREREALGLVAEELADTTFAEWPTPGVETVRTHAVSIAYTQGPVPPHRAAP